MPQVKVDYEFDDYQSLVQSAKAKVKKHVPLAYDEVVALFTYCVGEALEFFSIDSAWNVSILTGCTEDGAYVHFTPRYLQADISFNPEYFRKNPTEIRQAAVHEVAHIFLHKMQGFLYVLPQEYSEMNHPFNRYYEDAIEEMTTRMERLFFKCKAKAHAKATENGA